MRTPRWRNGVAGLSLAVAASVAACGAEIAPAFDISETGSIEGLVYFDASEDGLFDPADGDFPVAGVRVAVQARGTGENLAGGTTSSGADGRFSVTSVPVGTHDLLVDEATIPPGMIVCQNPLRVTVYADEARFANINGRPGCLITITESKDATLGDFVIVRGIVTSAPDQIEGSFAYIEDATAGVFLFAPALSGQGINVGDQIEVGGNTAIFNGQFELTGVALRDVVPNVTTPVPQLVTTAQIAASAADALDNLQNRFVQVLNAELIGAFGAGGTNLQNGTIDDGTGALTIRVDDGVADRNNLNTLFPVGKCYDITGIAANFNGGGQIFPRSMADMVEVMCN